MKAWQVVLLILGVSAGGVVLTLAVGGFLVAMDAPGPDRFLVRGVTPAQVAEAKRYGVPVAFANDLGMTFVLVPSGTVRAASTDGAMPREIRIERPFYIQVTEVTNKQFKAFQKDHDSGDYAKGKLSEDDQPAVMLSPAAATAFLHWLNDRDPGRTYNLPTEAEWMYAFLGGEGLEVPGGVPLDAPAWAEENLADQAAQKVFGLPKPGDFEGKGYLETDDGHAVAAPVGSAPPNGWRIHDLWGNVRELCADQTKKEITLGRLTRGACWGDLPFDLSRTGWIGEGDRSKWLGFRLVSPLPPGRTGSGTE